VSCGFLVVCCWIDLMGGMEGEGTEGAMVLEGLIGCPAGSVESNRSEVVRGYTYEAK
jgi:hypothetical protein